MNLNQYSCNVDKIYLMYEVLELNNVEYFELVKNYIHFLLDINLDKYFRISMDRNEAVAFKAATNWEHYIQKTKYNPKEYKVTYEVKLI